MPVDEPTLSEDACEENTVNSSLDEQSQVPPTLNVQAHGPDRVDEAEIDAAASDQVLEQRIAAAIQPLVPRMQEQAVQAFQAQLQETFQSDSTPEEKEPTDNASESGMVGTIVRPLVASVPEVLREQGEQPLRSLLDDALDTIFSEQVRAKFQHDAESTLEDLLDIALEVIPDEEGRRDLRMQAQQTLDELLQETLDQFFSRSLRADIEDHVERAINALVAGESTEAIRQGKLAFLTLFHDLSAVLQEHWHEILRFLFKVITSVLQEAITSAIKQGLASVVSEPIEELGDQVESVQDRLQEKGDQLRDELERAVVALRDRIQESAEELQERIQESVSSAVSDDGPSRGGFGQPPTGRPPSGWPPSGRPPSGRPPSGRPPSGRPPSAHASLGPRASARPSRRSSR